MASGGELLVHADDHAFADPAVGDEVLVETDDLGDGGVDAVGHLEEGEVGLADEAVLDEILAEEGEPGFPIVAAGGIDEDEGEDAAFSGLHEGEDFESFVHGAEAAGEEGDGVGLFDEVELAGEEVVEVDEFFVAVDDFVCALLERETDVEAEGFLAAGSALGGAHDAIAAAGDDHVIELAHLAGEFLGGLECGIGGRGAGGAEDDDFLKGGVGGEDCGRRSGARAGRG